MVDKLVEWNANYPTDGHLTYIPHRKWSPNSRKPSPGAVPELMGGTHLRAQFEKAGTRRHHRQSPPAGLRRPPRPHDGRHTTSGSMACRLCDVSALFYNKDLSRPASTLTAPEKPRGTAIADKITALGAHQGLLPFRLLPAAISLRRSAQWASGAKIEERDAATSLWSGTGSRRCFIRTRHGEAGTCLQCAAENARPPPAIRLRQSREEGPAISTSSCTRPTRK